VTWQDRTGHVAAPGCDTCHAFLAFLEHSWTNWKVTRVTTGWVTRGTRVTSASCVALTWQRLYGSHVAVDVADDVACG
jgi:hypothetical protein